MELPFVDVPQKQVNATSRLVNQCSAVLEHLFSLLILKYAADLRVC